MAEGIKPKNQLHQLLAVESDLRKKATKIMEEAIATFTKKQDHFDGIERHYEHFEVEEGQETLKVEPDIKEIVTTVADKLRYTQKSIVAAVDARISKEETNSSGNATAFLHIGNTTFGAWSATSLLALEGVLTQVRGLYGTIPTLDPVKRWNEDKGRKNVFVTPTQDTYRTAKKSEVVVLYPATKEHPAQTQLAVVDKQVGVFKTVYSSGKITPMRKSELLGQIDRLIIAVKKASSKANQVEIVNTKVMRKFFDFIHEEGETITEGE